MKDKEKKNTFDENLFRSMNYEMAGEIGLIDNEDMINNRKLPSKKRAKSKNKK